VQPRLSVVTTVYNGERYFDRGPAGILAQTYRDFEYIIVDDGSTDRTPEMLRELASKDDRIKLFFPGRLGITKAANFGLSQAQGEYIARQDFDDRSYPERLKLQMALLDARPEVGVVGGYYYLIDETRGERYVRELPTEHESIVAALAKSIIYANTTVMFRRKVWSDAGGYADVDDLEDQLLWLSAAKQGWRFGTVPEVVGEHYVHQTSFFHREFKYLDRQRNLARVQARFIRELALPKWMYLFVLGRYMYAYSPTGLKRIFRRTLAGTQERDI
jgi:glycosyltransferase EpsE